MTEPGKKCFIASTSLFSRRKFLKLSGTGAAASLAAVSCAGAYKRGEQSLQYISNPQCVTIKNGYPGNMSVDGVFVNEERSREIKFAQVIKWRFAANPQKAEKEKDLRPLNTAPGISFEKSAVDYVMWLGHSMFLMQIDGCTIITDPCLGSLPVVKRITPPPLKPRELPVPDILLVSHSHMDHLDSYTVKKMNLKNTMALLPLEMGKLVAGFNSGALIQEAGWYQQYSTPPAFPRVYMLPARHWSARGILGRNKILWGSYMIQGKEKTVYFAGDTGFSNHFREISSFFPDIDVCILPVGAYKPDYIMKQSHISPEEAADAFNIMKARTFIPMHYGTFDLSDEPYGEPVRTLESLRNSGGISGELRIPAVGEKIYF